MMLRNRTEEVAHEHERLVVALVTADAETALRVAVERIAAAQRIVAGAPFSSPALLEVPVALPSSSSTTC